MSSLNKDLDVEFRGHTVPVTILYYHPGDPGVVSGLPENCYPPEPAEIDFEVNSGHALLDDLLMNEFKDEFTDCVLEEFEDWIDYMEEERW